jgi:hypothetical protein
MDGCLKTHWHIFTDCLTSTLWNCRFGRRDSLDVSEKHAAFIFGSEPVSSLRTPYLHETWDSNTQATPAIKTFKKFSRPIPSYIKIPVLFICCEADVTYSDQWLLPRTHTQHSADVLFPYFPVRLPTLNQATLVNCPTPQDAAKVCPFDPHSANSVHLPLLP